MGLPDKEGLYGIEITLEKEMYIDVKNYIREKRGLVQSKKFRSSFDIVSIKQK